MRLFPRLFLSVTALISLIMLGVVYTMHTREREFFIQEARKKGETVARLLAMSSVNFLLTNDYSTMKRFVEAITADTDIIYVMILDPSGLIKMHNNLEMIGETVLPEPHLASQPAAPVIGGILSPDLGDRVLVQSEPIIVAERELGTVRLGISTRTMREAIATSRNRILVMGLLALIGGMIGSLVVARSVARPINRLMHSAKAISQGNLDVELEVASTDEVGVLTGAFRDMAEALKRNINELVRAEQIMIMGKMAAGLAHEIKNPLEAIKGSATFLEGKYQGDAVIGKFTRIIKDESQAVVSLIDDHLRYLRPAPPRMAPRDINLVIGEALQLAANLLQQHQVHLHQELTPGLPPILADSGQIKQVVMNLTLNAVEAMEGGGELTVRTFLRQPPAEQGGDKSSAVVMEVADTGKGMVEEQLKKIFDPFFTTKEKGSGLGLSITARIVEAHAGSIEVQSRLGEGTTFHLSLPVGEAGAKEGTTGEQR